MDLESGRGVWRWIRCRQQGPAVRQGQCRGWVQAWADEEEEKKKIRRRKINLIWTLYFILDIVV